MRIAFPHVDLEELNRFEPLGDEVDMTPSDLARLVAAITALTGIVVPESDYPSLVTVDGLERYVSERLDATNVLTSSSLERA
jgi:hypothetical protein